MIYITVELNKDIYIKIPKVKEGISPYTLTMTSQAGGQQMVFTDLVNNSDKSSVFRFTLNFTQYTPSGIYNYILTDTADKQISKGLVQVNMTDSEDYFYQDDELGYFVEDEGGSGDMSNYYTKSQIDSMLNQYEKKSDLPDFNNFVTLDQLTSQSYVTTEEMQVEVESYINSKDLINSTQLANTLEWYVTLNELQSMGYVTASELPTVNDATVTVKQGGNVMGSFTLNQSNNVEILLNEGGQGGGISMNDVKQYVDSQSYVTSDYLTSQSYITSDYLDNAGYITTANVRDNYYNKPETEANFTSYAYIEERISRIPGGGITIDDVKNYVVSQSYVTSDELSNIGYVTSEYLSNQAYITPSVLNAQSYVTATQLSNCGYATVSQIPTVSNAGIVLKQGGITKGTFTLNQSTGATIDFDAASSDITMDDVKQYVVSQSYVTSTALSNQAYITPSVLNAQSYITSNTLTDYATKSYVQEKINEIPVVDLSSYVKYSDLNNYGYQTSAQVQNTVNTSINSLNSYTLVFTLTDDSTVTIIAYTK